MNNLNLLQQLVARWKSKQPQIFKIITNISMVAAFITGVPELLDLFGIALPEWAAPFASKAVSIAAIVVAAVAKLTTDTPAATERVLEDINAGTKPEKAVIGK